MFNSPISDANRNEPGGSRPIQIHVLGRFEIVLDGTPVRFACKAPRKVLAVLKGLVCAGRRGVSQDTLQGALWPESDHLLARRALNTAVYRLRQLLRLKEAIQLNDGWLVLSPTLCWVDAWAFEQNVCEPTAWSELRSTLQLYGGTFLKGSDHPLVYDARERFRRKFVRAVLQLGQTYERAGDVGLAIDLYESALDIDSTPEDVHRALMRCHLREGRPAAVGAAYQRCRNVLWRYFSASPSPATEQIYRGAAQLRRGGSLRITTP